MRVVLVLLTAILLLSRIADAQCPDPETPCASCEHIRLYSPGPAPSGYYDISPDGVATINAYCIMEPGRGWTVIDPSHDAGWSQFFSSWTSRGPAYGPTGSPSHQSWAGWFLLSAGATFATSEDGTSITSVGQVYRMTGNYYGCYWYNGNCSFDGACHTCNDPSGQYQAGRCPYVPGSPTATYPHNCGFDWWNMGPSIGSGGTHLVAYAHQVEQPVPARPVRWGTIKALHD